MDGKAFARLLQEWELFTACSFITLGFERDYTQRSLPPKSGDENLLLGYQYLYRRN